MSKTRVLMEQLQVMHFSHKIIRVSVIFTIQDAILVISQYDMILFMKTKNSYIQQHSITINDKITTCHIQNNVLIVGTLTSALLLYRILIDQFQLLHSTKVDTSSINSICFDEGLNSYFIASHSLFKLEFSENYKVCKQNIINTSIFTKIKPSQNSLVLVKQQINANSIISLISPTTYDSINIQTYSVHSRSIQSIYCDKSNNYLITGDTQGMIVFWDLANEKQEIIFTRLLGGKIVSSQLDTEALILYVANQIGMVVVIDCQRNVILKSMFAHEAGLAGSLLTKDQYFTWDKHGIVKCWQITLK
ncbi:hypothetical protein SS50377_22168 [Spironucleus salmonicida]|uniref:Uncharacterized protein n=1 Tax=Spironucleus salmonicida TaxID=348837 RepID=V6LPP5_9EUKA|nr:hypothetical protein SS50377_22168 [Spironucleus salmonicida]|eukprot:EST45671.1 hypothetical protein SS50377_14243 [Spironucleus salmonicida]